MQKESDILLIDKPKGITSFDVIRRLRKKLNIKKFGHAGTLDPLASGLLIVGVEGGTKKLTEYLKLPKEYRAEILLGVRTDTGDITGKILEKVRVNGLGESEVKEVLAGMVGILNLHVPIYSAIKQGGQPLYKKARAGEEVKPPIKPMEVRGVKLLALIQESAQVVLVVNFDVGSGTYIRSLAEELGKRLGYPATVKELRRTRIGEYRVEDAERI